MRKRLLALALAGALTVGVVPSVALAEEGQNSEPGSVAVLNGENAYVEPKAADSGQCGDNLKWSLNGDTLTISGQGAMYDYNKYDNFVPWYGREFSHVAVEEGVTYIGFNAFSGFPDLQSVSLPSTLTTIGSYAFYDDTKLKEVEMPDGIKEIGTSAFASCTSLTTIDLPSGLESIPEFAFSNCSRLTSISIPEGVTEIGATAFSQCFQISQISIPSSVTTIEEYAFEGITRASVSYNGSAAQWCDMMVYHGNDLLKTNIDFEGDPTMPETITGTSGDITWVGNLATGELTISGTGTVQVASSVPNWSAKYHVFTPLSVIVQSGITGIGSSVFKNHNQLTNISLPETLTSIGDEAFYSCTQLSKISIPTSVTSIGRFVFWECQKLTEVIWPESLATIPVSAFSGCTGLTTITIPASVTDIKMMAFSLCDNLKSVYYTGDQDQWDAINIGILNDALANATIYYNYGSGSQVSGIIANGLTDVTVELYDQDGALMTSVVGSGSYTLEGVPVGTYTLKVSKPNYATREYQITVGNSTVEQNVALNLIGDVTGDGTVDVLDLNRLYAHVSGTLPITDSYAAACADAISGGELNVMDLNRIYAHVSGANLLW